MACVLGASVVVSAAAAECPSPASGALAPPAAPQTFTQERHLKGASRPIVSSGVASVADEVVTWRVTTPIEIVTRIADDGVSQSIEGGPFEPVGETAGAGFASQIGFAALLRADTQALERSYQIEHSPTATDAHWSFTLIPRDRQLAQQITAIDVTGCSSLQSVNVRQFNGDQVLIRFSGPAG